MTKLLPLLGGTIMLAAVAQKNRLIYATMPMAKKILYNKMLKQLVQEDVMLLGEFPYNAIAHYVQP